MNNSFETLIDGLVDGDAGTCEHFLPSALALALQKKLVLLEKEDRLVFAGIGNDRVKDHQQQQRGDKICWIDNESTDPAEAGFFELIRTFIGHLNSSCYTRINDFEFHYARYETGSFYRRHLDQFKTNSDRKFSLICYLNDDWQDSDGGELCLYHPGRTEKIFPRIETTVLFRSDRCEHEVLQALRPRMSITGWLKSTP